MTETINGLHKCKAKNTPVEGEVKNMVVEHKPPRNGKKAWIKITNKKPEDGGTPYRILGVEKLDWPPDEHQNIAFNIEVEATTDNDETTQVYKRSEFAQARATMQQGEAQDYGDVLSERANTPQSPPRAQQGEDGVMATRKHLMQSANLLVLCIRAVENAVAPHQPVVAQTSEQFQSDVAKLFIEASSRRTTDGINWWSYVDRMPMTPIATTKPIQKEENDEPPF